LSTLSTGTNSHTLTLYLSSTWVQLPTTTDLDYCNLVGLDYICSELSDCISCDCVSCVYLLAMPHSSALQWSTCWLCLSRAP